MKANRNIVRVVLGALSAFIATTASIAAQERRAVTAPDCVTVQYLLRDSLRPTLQVNPKGNRVAYLVKSPNLQTNQNDIKLYVGTLDSGEESAPHLVLTSEETSSLQWEKDGRHIVLLVKNGGRKEIEEIDAVTGEHSTLMKADSDVVEYSVTPDAKTIVFALETSSLNPNAPDLPRTAEESMSGYRIQFASVEKPAFPTRRIFISSQTALGQWATPRQVVIRSPLTHQQIHDVPYEAELGLSIAPDGTKVLFRYIDSSTARPQSWRDSEFVQKALVATGYSGTPLLALYNAVTKDTTIPIQSPFPNGVATWSSDSDSFMINAQSPVGSVWEADDINAKRLLASKGEHLFWVGLSSHLMNRVTPPNALLEQLVSWSTGGKVVVRTTPNEITQIAQHNDKFEITNRVSIPAPDLSPYSQLAGDGNRVILDDQNITTPPRLQVFQPQQGTLRDFAYLNPQFGQIRLVPTRRVSWALPDGYRAEGILFTPPDYQVGKRYPLVISATVYGGGFVCDSGDIHLPAFAPLPLAESGMLYLMRTYPPDWTLTSQQEHYPKGYPGGISEAAFQTELWDSAVDKLSGEGIVDRRRVGIIGFSRTGWYTEFALVHGRTPYKAATAVDNVKYSLGEYWLSPRREGTVRGYDAIYGGPPYGATRSAWEQYSISFNLDKIHTPLLMEQMGYGRQYDRSIIPPVPLSSSLELFAGLTRLNRPVDFFYYPSEEHQPDHPLARLASLQRNIDWYRFWLQGHQDPAPSKASQYSLWLKFETFNSRP